MMTSKRVVRNYTVSLNGRQAVLAARPGTTDIDMIKMTFSGRFEYPAPIEVDPKVIFDVGAHIGAVSVYYALAYPRAKIYAFEPFGENYNLLKLNASSNSRRIIPV